MRDEDGCVVAEGGKKSSRQKGLKKKPIRTSTSDQAQSRIPKRPDPIL